MDPLAIATQVVYATTGENIVGARLLTEKNTLQDFEIITESWRVFTVTVNVKTKVPTGHFFEGNDPIKSQLQNFNLLGETEVVLE